MTILNNINQSKQKQAWKNFLSGKGSTDDVRPEILTAWERCKKLGTDPYKRSPDKLIHKHEIEQRIVNNKKLLEVSKPAIKYLYNFIAGSKLFVSVSDVDGYLLLVYCDEEMVPPARELLYTNWSEGALGNNPIGTPIIEDRALFVRGYEHYSIYPHYYTGAGSPLHDPNGNIIGAISITGKTKIAQHHTLGMIVMTAYAIERQLKILETLASLDTAYNHRNTIIDSISEGLLVIDEKYNITFVNQVFNKFFSLEDGYIVNKNIFSFFSDSLAKDIINNKSHLTDYVTEINLNNTKFPCTITYRPIRSEFSNDGVIVINELSRVKKLAKRISESGSSITFNDIIGQNKNFVELINTSKSLALTESNILLLGDSGTGKDVFAQAIHNYSNRRNGPFIAINCGAIPKNLINSELFGYTEGAFTGASKGGSIGKFEMANGGTIFLDEIGEMSLEGQTALLRVIETRLVTPVGGRSYVPINVRIIAATNKHLPTEITLNTFRQDLYYRLNVLSITLPPLRERKDDIKSLTIYFLNQLSQQYGKAINNVPAETWEKLLDYDWPGNIRELKNIIERCVALAKSDILLPELISDDILSKVSIVSSKTQLVETKLASQMVDEETTLRDALEINKWNITKVSKELGVSRTTIYRKIKQFEI